MLLIGFVPLLLASCAQAGADAADPLTPWLEGRSLSLHKTHDPVGFDAFHVQGLWVSDGHFFLTSVKKAGLEGWIFKVDRTTRALAASKNLARGWDIHPGGIDFDGERIWVPLATYTRNSHAFVLSLDPEDLTERVEFEVEDHVGAIACLPNQIVGANWDAEDFYFWEQDGTLVEKRKNPTGIAYQDMKGMGRCLVCTGKNVVDWIDWREWRLVKRYVLEETSRQGHGMGREGVSPWGESVFLMPDDGRECRLYEYRLDQ